jgi:hypothetical protein
VFPPLSKDEVLQPTSPLISSLPPLNVIKDYKIALHPPLEKPQIIRKKKFNHSNHHKDLGKKSKHKKSKLNNNNVSNYELYDKKEDGDNYNDEEEGQFNEFNILPSEERCYHCGFLLLFNFS